MMAGFQQDTPHSVRDSDGRRWPAPEGIPYLRCGRDDVAAEALAYLDAGEAESALVLLLADQDDWWSGPTADAGALRELVRNHERLTLREAMALLSWGPVADYFAHRWSDPTFLAGLALMETHWTAPSTCFELSCGIGHFLRELSRHHVVVTGADVVFAKLWLARHFVVPGARLLCIDAAQAWPALGKFDVVMCHDAFYFLEPKQIIAEKLRDLLAKPSGLMLLSHVHNRNYRNQSAGHALTADQMNALFPDGLLYDDAELTGALLAKRSPSPARVEQLQEVEAFAAAVGPGLLPPRPISGLLSLPQVGSPLQRNPLYDGRGRICWPSGRYQAEYGHRVTYPPQTAAPPLTAFATAWEEQVRRRELLHLPERW